jgi:hypothetical protein
MCELWALVTIALVVTDVAPLFEDAWEPVRPVMAGAHASNPVRTKVQPRDAFPKGTRPFL